MTCRTRRAVPAIAALVLAGCGGSGGATGPAPSERTLTAAPSAGTTTPIGDADWPTYHHDNARTGVSASTPPLGTPRTAWTARLDGAVYGQPLVVGGTVYAATENDTVYALDPATGAVRWSARLDTPMPRHALPCGDIDPLGITSTMAYDPATGLLFALAESLGAHHTLYGIEAATGAVRVTRAAEPPTGDPVAHQQRSALTVLGDRVYIAYGGLAGDCGHYVGSVVSLPTVGTGTATSYAVPTPREGGIWAPGGASVRDGRLYYPVGNGESVSGYDGSDSVLALDAGLGLADRYSPGTWAADNDADLDLGSMTPALVGPYVFADGKRGVGYTLRASKLGGIGTEVARAQVCRAFGGASVDADVVYVPCADGPRAVRVDTASGAISVLWHADTAAAGSPVVGGGAVWVVDTDKGVLEALDPATGAVRARVGLGGVPHFASPTLSGARAYVGTMTGVVAVDTR